LPDCDDAKAKVSSCQTPFGNIPVSSTAMRAVVDTLLLTPMRGTSAIPAGASRISRVPSLF